MHERSAIFRSDDQGLDRGLPGFNICSAFESFLM
jgi:hypothetical protein